jgi:hypothetical protein
MLQKILKNLCIQVPKKTKTKEAFLLIKKVVNLKSYKIKKLLKA